MSPRPSEAQCPLHRQHYSGQCPTCQERHRSETVDAMLDHGTTTIETTTEPDGMGRQRFSVVWWDEDFHAGPQWRGQHFFMRLDEFLNQPGNACLVAPAKRVVLRHLVEKKR